MSDQTAPLLTVRDLVIEGFQDGVWRPIVDGVSFELRRGEVLGLIGESGAGKSTIGIAAMGYTRHGCRIAGGRIALDGTDLTQAPAEQLRALRGMRVAYVAQSAAASFNPAHRLVDQCAETAIQHGVLPAEPARQRAAELFARLHLPQPTALGQRYPHEVSGGQLQRAMVAMAMSCRPDLVVFDEPTTALDVTTQIEVLKVIREAIAAFGLAALYISHDLAVVAQVAHRVMVLRHGRMVEHGAVQDIVAHPREGYTAALLAAGRTRHPKPLADADAPAFLDLRGITAAYRHGAPVLHDVTVQVAQGTTVALVGESGSGKSTLARVVAGLLPPMAGTVRFGGAPLAGSFKQRTLDQLRRIQIVYQMPDTALNPRAKLADIVGRPAQLYEGLSGAARTRRAAELLDMVELGARYLDRHPSEMSGGEKQRAGIARALAARPDLIVCDEVTSALDQLVAEGVLTLLQRLQRDLRLTLLFITHDFAAVRAVADAVVVMRHGRVAEAGPVARVIGQPQDAYTRRLLDSVPELDPAWLTRRLAADRAGTA